MTARLRVAVATDELVAARQARVADALAAVPGVELVSWTARPRRPSDRPASSGRRALATAETPATLSRQADRPANERAASSGEVVDIAFDLTGALGPGPAERPAAVWRFRYGQDGLVDPIRAARLDYLRRRTLIDQAHAVPQRDGRAGDPTAGKRFGASR
jgi:hypothetical protein